MAGNTETRRTSGDTESSAAKAASDAGNTVKLYSDCYVGGESMTQHYLYGIKAVLTEEGFLCIDAPQSLVEANQDRNFPLLNEVEYRKMLKNISNVR